MKNRIKIHKFVERSMFSKKKELNFCTNNINNIFVDYEIEEINEDNISFYQPEDNYFNLKKLFKRKKSKFFGLKYYNMPVAFFGIVQKGGISSYFKIESDIHLEALYTFEKFRGHGCIGFLISSILAESYSYVDTVSLCVRPDNKVAENLYIKWGFSPGKIYIIYKKGRLIFPLYRV